MNGNDPWKHRGAGMKCSSCMWFVVKQKPSPEVVTVTSSLRMSGDTSEKECDQAIDPRGPLGRCRRHAPTMNGYPAVFANDWCGDHKMDESKI